MIRNKGDGSSLSLDDILIVVFTCKKFKARARSVLATWAKDLRNVWFITDEDTQDFAHCVNLGRFSYEELSRQTYLLWKYLREQFCSSDKYKWIVKLDDDTYLEPGNLLKFLSGLDHDRPWYIGDYEFYSNACQRRLTWIPGPSLVFSRRCFQELTDFLMTENGRALYFKPMHGHKRHGEDLAIGQCLDYLRIYPTHGNGFYYRIDDLDILKKPDKLIAAHLMSPARMYILHWLYQLRNKFLLSAGIDAAKLFFIFRRFINKMRKNIRTNEFQ